MKDLRIVMQSSPVIFILVRSYDIDELIEGLVKRFHDLARHNPITDSFNTPENPSLSNSSLKEMGLLPKFIALLQMHFDE